MAGSVSPRRFPAEPPRSILVLKPSSFGDLVHTLPAVARLKAHWPTSRISWLVNPEWSPLLQENPLVDDIVIFPRHDFRGWQGPWRLQRWLRAQIVDRRPDLALDFQGLLRTAFIGRFARAGRFFGLADAREGARWFYDEMAAVPPGVPHAVERYLALSDLVIQQAQPANPSKNSTLPLSFPLPPGRPLGDPWQIPSRYVLLHPFARGEGKSLVWSDIQGICRGLQPQQVLLVGKSQGPGPVLPNNVFNLVNQTSLGQLIWLIRHATFVVSVDSGPAHLAAALDKPLVAIHTWSDPRRVGPYRPDAWVLKNGELFQVETLRVQPETMFRPSGARHTLSAAQIDAICQVATSP